MMRYVAYDKLEGSRSIIVDGSPAPGTVLTLSHWAGSGSPEELADDLSTQIAFNYLDRPDLHVDAECVSNNHFDEDGLCGIYALLDPEGAQARRKMLIDVASAGDFGTFALRDAARVAFAIGAYSDRERSPLDLSGPYPRAAEALHQELLPRLPELIDHPERARDLWQEEDARYERDAARIAGGGIAIEEHPDVDLAEVVILDGGGAPHEMAVHNATQLLRILTMEGRRYELRYRYETWVRFVSRPTMPRVDLTSLAEQLNALEGSDAWAFDDIGDLTPALRSRGDGESVIDPSRFRSLALAALREAATSARAR